MKPMFPNVDGGLYDCMIQIFSDALTARRKTSFQTQERSRVKGFCRGEPPSYRWQLQERHCKNLRGSAAVKKNPGEQNKSLAHLLPLAAIRAGRPPWRGAVSMKAAVVEAVVDRRSRRHVKHRSDQGVRVRRTFFPLTKFLPTHTHILQQRPSGLAHWLGGGGVNNPPGVDFYIQGQ